MRRHHAFKFLARHWQVIPILMTVLVTLPVQPVFAQDPFPPGIDFVPGEVVVKMKPNAAAISAHDLLSAQDLQAVQEIETLDMYKVLVQPGQEEAVAQSLSLDPGVLYAEPNYLVYALETIPNDPFYGNQWGFPKIEAPRAWDFTTGSSGLIIGVVDSGIDLDHPDLSCAGKLTAGYDFVNGDADPDDDYGHGSHVAGIAGACTNNAVGVGGMAWNTRLMPVKVLNSVGGGTSTNLAKGIEYAVNHGAQIINLSLGTSADSATIEDACQYAYDNGVLVVASAGNYAQSGNPVYYPAAYETTLAVAATDDNDNWASFSEHHDYVDVSAPGVSIYSTYRNSSYNSMNGTSMAAPFVSGLAALILSLNPSLSRDQIRTTIESTVDDLGNPGKDEYFGYGRINAWQALSPQFNPSKVTFGLFDNSGPYPETQNVQLTTISANPITWTAHISPAVAWLSLSPTSGTASYSTPGQFTLVATRPTPSNVYSATTIVMTGTTSAGTFASATSVQVEITPHWRLLPVIFKAQ